MLLVGLEDCVHHIWGCDCDPVSRQSINKPFVFSAWLKHNLYKVKLIKLMNFDKCVQLCNNHQITKIMIQNFSIILKCSIGISFNPFTPPTNRSSVFYLHGFAFYKLPSNHTVYKSFKYDIFLSIRNLRFINVVYISFYCLVYHCMDVPQFLSIPQFLHYLQFCMIINKDFINYCLQVLL